MPRSLVPAYLRYFEQVAQTGSIQGASRELHVSASAIDRQILKVEEQLGTELFERLPRGMRLTAAGEILQTMVQRWHHDERAAVAELSQLRGVRQGQVRLFAMDSNATSVLPRLAEVIRASHPFISLSIEIGSTDEAVASLLSGNVDAIIAFNLPQNPAVLPVWMCELPFGCIVAPDHHLSGQGENVLLEQIAAYPMAFQSRSLLIRQYLESQYSWLFADPSNRIETNSLQLVKKLVQGGRFVAFTSELDAAEEIAEGTLVFLQLQKIGAMPQTVTVAVNVNQPVSAPVRVILDEVVRVIQTLLEVARARS